MTARADEVEPHSCAVCGRVLDMIELSDGSIEWQHTAATYSDGLVDHVCVPVPDSMIRTETVCDFCTAPGSRWELPAESYVIEELPGYASQGGWGACDDCAAAIRAGDWNKVRYRAARAFKQRHPELSVRHEYYVIMYRELRKHVTGPIRLWTKLEGEQL